MWDDHWTDRQSNGQKHDLTRPRLALLIKIGKLKSLSLFYWCLLIYSSRLCLQSSSSGWWLSSLRPSLWRHSSLFSITSSRFAWTPRSLSWSCAGRSQPKPKTSVGVRQPRLKWNVYSIGRFQIHRRRKGEEIQALSRTRRADAEQTSLTVCGLPALEMKLPSDGFQCEAPRFPIIRHIE